MGLTGFGVFFFVMGIIMFLDRGLLAIGNMLFLAGIPMLIGVSRTMRFFFQWGKAKGTGCFLAGIAILLYGYTLLGIIVELFGFVNLFGDFFPTVKTTLCSLPFVGRYFAMVLNAPPVLTFTNWLSSFSSRRIPTPRKGP